MAFDAHKNFAYSTVATAPSPAASGTSLVVAAGQGALFPAVPFNAILCPANTPALASNAEIVRVTARATDTLTIARTQESTAARTVLVGDQIFADITLKTLSDIEGSPVFTGVVSALGFGTHTFSAGATGVNALQVANTTDGTGNNAQIRVVAGTTTGYLIAAPQSYVGAPYTPASSLFVGTDAAGGVAIGALHASGVLLFFAGGSTERWRIRADGYLQTGTLSAGNEFIAFGAGQVTSGRTGTGANTHLSFFNANGSVGSIATTGTTTTYNTASDARLKQDRGVAVTTDILARTRIHDFEWRVDGTRGRGVFAQEAIEVAPFAVTAGGDDLKDGQFYSWLVDYSKYVPDLIVGWQQHEARLAALEQLLHRKPVHA